MLHAAIGFGLTLAGGAVAILMFATHALAH
jgi:hypothetical protein